MFELSFHSFLFVSVFSLAHHCCCGCRCYYCLSVSLLVRDKQNTPTKDACNDKSSWQNRRKEKMSSFSLTLSLSFSYFLIPFSHSPSPSIPLLSHSLASMSFTLKLMGIIIRRGTYLVEIIQILFISQKILFKFNVPSVSNEHADAQKLRSHKSVLRSKLLCIK